MNYAHNKLINGLFQRARATAWAQMRSDPNVMMLIRARKKEEASRYNTSRNPQLGRQQLQEARTLLEMTNR